MEQHYLIQQEKRDSVDKFVEKYKGVVPLNQRVTETLRALIVNGVFEPEVRLTEELIASLFGVSRTPVRDAFTALVKEGFLVYSRRGLTIRQWSIDDFFNIYEIVMHLDALAAQSAANHGLSPSARLKLLTSLELLETTAEAQQSAPDDQKLIEETAQYNHEFHMEIARNCGNEWLPPLLESMRMKLLALRPCLKKEEFAPQYLGGHMEILEAIITRNPQKAYEMAAEHIKHSVEQASPKSEWERGDIFLC